jgi:Tol biopolymer transport system component
MKRLTIICLLLLTAGVVTHAQNLREPRFGPWTSPINIASPVNSTADDVAPVISKDGRTLYFSSTRTGSKGVDIWVSKRPNERAEWGEPVNLGPVVNSAGVDRVRSISPDGRVLLFQSNRLGAGGTDIWASVRQSKNDDLSWGPPVNLGTTINSSADEVAANYLFSSDKRRAKFFFSSARFGQPDIYESDIPFEGSFGEPVGVAELNSPFVESCIWISADGLEIIFSSTRPDPANLLSSYDLFAATRATVNDRWDPPASLGEVVNAEGYQDVGPNVSSDGETLYFSSRRPGGLGPAGSSDIYVSTRRRLRGNQ